DRFRASTDDRSPWGDFWFEPVSTRSASGLRVSPDAALRLSAVYACVRILSETMASLPLVLYRNRADGSKDRVTDHWLYPLLCRRPNRFQNPFEWREMLQGHLALRGNAYNQIVTNPRGEIIELIPIHPDRVRIELLRSGEFRYRVTDRFGEESILARGDVWHLRGQCHSQALAGQIDRAHTQQSVRGQAAQVPDVAACKDGLLAEPIGHPVAKFS
ncbi:MAG: phage portal protein, partial [Betaproteobacteria bacterium]|nr:phage portal protein [Betaproteobacteria bacterium]